MARLLRFSSRRFERRTTDYFYPQARAERPRISQRELALSGYDDDDRAAESGRERGGSEG